MNDLSVYLVKLHWVFVSCERSMLRPYGLNDGLSFYLEDV
jgi:hypothetical protein